MTIQQDYAVKTYTAQDFTATGQIGPEYLPTNTMGALRVAISNVGGGSEVIVRGRLRGQTSWTTLSTITGSTTGTTVDISVHDEIGFYCNTFEASGGTPHLIASAFFSDDTVNVVITSTPLPPDAATETTLSALNTKIPASPAEEHVTAASPHATRLSDGSSFYNATTPSDTQPISAVSLPLPTGAATETTLSAMNTKIPASPAAEHTSAASPHSVRLSTGSAFYNATTPADIQRTIEYGINSLPNYYSNIFGLFNIPACFEVDPITGTVGFVSAAGGRFVCGSVAHDAADSEPPLKTGFRARKSRITAIAENDRSDATGDVHGQQWIDSSEYSIAIGTITSTTPVTIIAAPGSGLKLVVYNIWISGWAEDALAKTGAFSDQAGVEFRYGSGTYMYQTVWQTASGMGSTDGSFAVNLSMNPVDLVLQHGHWNGGNNEAFSARLMSITTTLLHTFYVTVAYRTYPV